MKHVLQALRIATTTQLHIVKILTCSTEGPSERLSNAKRSWGQNIMKLLNVSVETFGETPAQDGAILVGNHVSYLDIPFLVSLTPTTFVSKSEVASWPIFGLAGRCGRVFWVKRGCEESKRQLAFDISKRFRTDPSTVLTVFPSGTTSLSEQKPWRHGIFRLAAEHRIPIQPFRLRYWPLRPVAYIDHDHFVRHLLDLAKIGSVRAEIEFGPCRIIENPIEECTQMQRWAQEFVVPTVDVPLTLH